MGLELPTLVNIILFEYGYIHFHIHICVKIQYHICFVFVKTDSDMYHLHFQFLEYECRIIRTIRYRFPPPTFPSVQRRSGMSAHLYDLFYPSRFTRYKISLRARIVISTHVSEAMVTENISISTTNASENEQAAHTPSVLDLVKVKLHLCLKNITSTI